MSDRITEKLCALLQVPPQTKRATLHMTYNKLAQLTLVTDIASEDKLRLDEKVEQFELVPKRGPSPELSSDLDEDSPMWLVNAQIDGLLEGEGASEDHENVIKFLRQAGLPGDTAKRVHLAICHGDAKARTFERIDEHNNQCAEFANQIVADPSPFVLELLCEFLHRGLK